MSEDKNVSTIRGLLDSGKTLLSLCCHDALSARIIEMAGFPMVMVSGFGSSASMLAAPDFGLLSQTEGGNGVRLRYFAISLIQTNSFDQ